MLKLKLLWQQFIFKVRKPIVFLRHFWHTFYVRKNEFHISLETDMEYIMYLNQGEIEEYLRDLIVRRQIAHNRNSSLH